MFHKFETRKKGVKSLRKMGLVVMGEDVLPRKIPEDYPPHYPGTLPKAIGYLRECGHLYLPDGESEEQIIVDYQRKVIDQVGLKKDTPNLGKRIYSFISRYTVAA